ncbi:MAG: ATP-binding protein [Leptospiraceae bacterium]|nr:ATP-binding protein [Leptospiraceae bacterium]
MKTRRRQIILLAGVSILILLTGCSLAYWQYHSLASTHLALQATELQSQGKLMSGIFQFRVLQPELTQRKLPADALILDRLKALANEPDWQPPSRPDQPVSEMIIYLARENGIPGRLNVWQLLPGEDQDRPYSDPPPGLAQSIVTNQAGENNIRQSFPIFFPDGSVAALLVLYQTRNALPLAMYMMVPSILLAAMITIAALWLTQFRVVRLQQTLRQSFRKLNESRHRYKYLIENSNDILFTLDRNLRVLTVNRSVMEHLGLTPRALIGQNIMDIIFFQEDSLDPLNRNIILEKFNQLIQRKINKIRFKSQFQLKATGEVQPYRLEFSLPRPGSKRKRESRSEKMEIYGRAEKEDRDILVAAFVRERRSYAIGNSLIEAEEISRRITRNLRRYIPDARTKGLNLAVRELILNAIEHGNLGITYEEKTKALQEGHYMRMFRHRREDPRLRDRRVFIDFILNERVFWVRITDQGEGFDSQGWLDRRMDSPAQLTATHGRGLLLARDGFNSLRYNEAGNSVTGVFRIANS